MTEHELARETAMTDPNAIVTIPLHLYKRLVEKLRDSYAATLDSVGLRYAQNPEDVLQWARENDDGLLEFEAQLMSDCRRFGPSLKDT